MAYWAQCEAYSKLHRLPMGLTPPSEAEVWHSWMNPDPACNTCAAAEQTEEEAVEAEVAAEAEAAAEVAAEVAAAAEAAPTT